MDFHVNGRVEPDSWNTLFGVPVPKYLDKPKYGTFGLVHTTM